MVGKLYRYPKTGHVYRVMEELRMKDPKTGEWVDGVIYTDGDSTYCRAKEDFINKFVLENGKA